MMNALLEKTDAFRDKEDKMNWTMRKLHTTTAFCPFSAFQSFSRIASTTPRSLPVVPMSPSWNPSLSSCARYVARISCAMLQQRLMLCVLLILLQMTTGATGVKVNEVRVPHPGILGESASLECLWESGDKDFYSVRWYMNDKQFYSFILGNVPEKVNHRLKGINVALSHSNRNIVTLSKLTLEAEGTYRCELMSEAPYFQTSMASANLTVVKKPDVPEIHGVKEKYRVGETLNATCTVRNSRPAAELSFYINNKRVHPDSGRVRNLGVVGGFYEEIFTTTSQLVFPLSNHHAQTLTLACRAHVFNLEEETSLTVHVDPARTTMLTFFSSGVSRVITSSITILVTSSVLLLFYGSW